MYRSQKFQSPKGTKKQFNRQTKNLQQQKTNKTNKQKQKSVNDLGKSKVLIVPQYVCDYFIIFTYRNQTVR